MNSLKMLRKDAKLNARLNRIVTKYITPVVLLIGLLLLALVHFRGVLNITTAQTDLFHGMTAYNVGSMETMFQHNAGTDRPNITYQGINLLNYVDWNSTISIDGHVQNLWDNTHGYDQDSSTRQIFSTTSGQGWQVVEVITLVNDHTVTVHYDFVARSQGTASPHDVMLNIVHTHATWSSPTINGNVFTAGVLPISVPSLIGQTLPQPVGTLTLKLDGPGVATATPITINDLYSNVGPNGKMQSIASSVTTAYHLSNPAVNKLTPLGTETIIFSTSAPTGTPLPGGPQHTGSTI